jgi:alkylated DNA nucleotide flippase Atl1
MKSKVEASARQRILDAPAPVVAALEGEKAARFKASTMLIPSPAQVEEAIRQIPFGQAVTLAKLRLSLANSVGADVTCPYTARICWELVAVAAEEDRAEGMKDVTPWWRVTKDHKPSARLPGGERHHRALLGAEGIAI